MSDQPASPAASSSTASNVISVVSELARRYELQSLHPLIDACRGSATRTDVTVAVLGRFKAGKSSFLNHLIGRELLPMGVVPVTAVITEVTYGIEDRASVRFQGGREAEIPVQAVPEYAAESANPLNRKGVASIGITVPAAKDWQGLRFVDTPGLDSTLAHNAEASLGWAPNADVALVAVGVDPPLSENDVWLIQTLLNYTPHVAILLTKVDSVGSAQLDEILRHVRTQLKAGVNRELPIYTYSIRAGFEHLREGVEGALLRPLVRDIARQRRMIHIQKLSTLLAECEQYLRLALKSAQLLDSDRAALRAKLGAERMALEDAHSRLHLIANHTLAGARASIEKSLQPCEPPIRETTLAAFDSNSPGMPKNLASMLASFRDWLEATLTGEFSAASQAKKPELVRILSDVQRQYQDAIQIFRDRLAKTILALYGVPLRTTEIGISYEQPEDPDVQIGWIFDRNWELLSPVIPMRIFRPMVLKHFRRKIVDETAKNLSRLATQWQDAINAGIVALRREADERLNAIMETVDNIVSASKAQASQVRADLERLETLRSFLDEEASR